MQEKWSRIEKEARLEAERYKDKDIDILSDSSSSDSENGDSVMEETMHSSDLEVGDEDLYGDISEAEEVDENEPEPNEEDLDEIWDTEDEDVLEKTEDETEEEVGDKSDITMTGVSRKNSKSASEASREKLIGRIKRLTLREVTEVKGRKPTPAEMEEAEMERLAELFKIRR
jgi:hypothetical protein